MIHNWLTPAFIKKMFPSALPGTHSSRMINKYGPIIIDSIERNGRKDPRYSLVALATIRAETEGFEPIKEFISKYNTEQAEYPFSLYDFRSDLGNFNIGDGSKYAGRGFIQLTGRNNYAKYGEMIKVDLLNKPELACDPVVASNILCAFLNDHWDSIVDALDRNNMEDVRKEVNGGVHGIVRFKDAYRRGLEELIRLGEINAESG